MERFRPPFTFGHRRQLTKLGWERLLRTPQVLGRGAQQVTLRENRRGLGEARDVSSAAAMELLKGPLLWPLASCLSRS